jgi:peptide/nickel transport system substrate-binding protein
LVVAALALLVASCSQSGAATDVVLTPVTGGTLTVGLDQSPTGCNPDAGTQTDSASRTVLEAVLPSTFVVTASGASTGNQSLVDQAELVSTSPQTVVYTIDSHAEWSDGVPITAADFRYAWEQQRGLDPATGLPVPADASTLGYRDIKSVTPANHGKTVTVVFKQPYAQWQMLFDPLMPAHVMQRVGWNPTCTVLRPDVDLSGGPFEIRSANASRVVLVRNPHWWGPEPMLDKVVIRVATSAGQLAGWLRTGTAQVAAPTVPTPGFVDSVVANPRVESDLDVTSTFLQLEFATQGTVTSSVEVRQAVAHAVDRQSVVSQVTGWLDGNVVPSQSHLYTQNQSAYPSAPGAQVALNDFLASNGSGSPTTTTTTSPAPGSGAPFPTTADEAATTRDMLAAGYLLGPDGRWATITGAPVVLRLVVDAGDSWTAETAPLLAGQLERAGFDVQISTQPTAASTGAILASGAADLALLPFEATPYPTTALAEYTDSLGLPGQDGSQNWANLDDPTVESLLDQAEHQLNPVKAQPIYAQVDALLWTDMAALPLFAEPGLVAWSVQTEGVTPSFHGPNLLTTVGTWQLRRPLDADATSTTDSTP